MKTKKSRVLVQQCFFEALEDRRLLSASLAGSFDGHIPAALPPQGSSQISVRVTNVGDALVKEPATVTLFASLDGTLDGGDTPLGGKTIKLNLVAGKFTVATVKFSSPTTLVDGNYFILAEVHDGTGPGDVNDALNNGVTQAMVHITQPIVDLTASIKSVPTATIHIAARQKSTSLSTTLTNHGNVAAKGSVEVSYYLSTDRTLDPSDLLVFSGPKTVNINPGKSKAITVSSKLGPDTPTGDLFLLASVNADHHFVEPDTTNNLAASTATITIDNPAVPPGPWLLGGLKSDADVVITGQADLIHFSAHASEPSSSTRIEIDEVDAQGGVIGKITDLVDNGSAIAGDSIAGDGVFTGLSSIEIDSLGTRRFVAVLTDPSVTNQRSDALVVTAKDPPSEQQIQQDAADSQAAAAKAKQVMAAKGSPKAAIKAVKIVIQASGNFIPDSIATSSDAIQWQSSDGCMYLLNTSTFNPALSSDDGLSSDTFVPASSLIPQASPSADNGGTAISIAPFESGMETSGIELARDAADLLTAAGYTVTRRFDGAGDLDAFRNLGSYDAVVIHSHGGTLDGGGEAILTSEQASFLGDLANAWDLYFTHRIIKAVNPDLDVVYYAITPGFISAYSGSMNNTIVFAGACDSAADDQMANAFINHGAAAYIGFTGLVNRLVDNSDGIAAFQTLLKSDHNTVGDIPHINTFDDPSDPGTKFVESGDINATLPHGDLLKDNDLYVTYDWPQTQRDLDTNTRFLNVSVGWHLASSPYINWSGDDTSAGGTEVSIVNLYSAWQNSAWAGSTTVTVGADWYSPAGGSGPAFITIALKNKITGIFTHSSSFTISPGQEYAGASTTLETVNVTLTGDTLNPSVHIAIA